MWARETDRERERERERVPSERERLRNYRSSTKQRSSQVSPRGVGEISQLFIDRSSREISSLTGELLSRVSLSLSLSFSLLRCWLGETIPGSHAPVRVTNPHHRPEAVISFEKLSCRSKASVIHSRIWNNSALNSELAGPGCNRRENVGENQRQKNIRRISDTRTSAARARARLWGNIEFAYIRRFDNPRGSRLTRLKLRLSAGSDREKEMFRLKGYVSEGGDMHLRDYSGKVIGFYEDPADTGSTWCYAHMYMAMIINVVPNVPRFMCKEHAIKRNNVGCRAHK